MKFLIVDYYFYCFAPKSKVILSSGTYLVKYARTAPIPATVTMVVKAVLTEDSGSGMWKNSTKPS